MRHLAASLTQRLQDVGRVSPAPPPPEPASVGEVPVFPSRARGESAQDGAVVVE